MGLPSHQVEFVILVSPHARSARHRCAVGVVVVGRGDVVSDPRRKRLQRHPVEGVVGVGDARARGRRDAARARALARRLILQPVEAVIGEHFVAHFRRAVAAEPPAAVIGEIAVDARGEAVLRPRLRQLGDVAIDVAHHGRGRVHGVDHLDDAAVVRRTVAGGFRHRLRQRRVGDERAVLGKILVSCGRERRHVLRHGERPAERVIGGVGPGCRARRRRRERREGRAAERVIRGGHMRDRPAAAEAALAHEIGPHQSIVPGDDLLRAALVALEEVAGARRPIGDDAVRP